MTLYKVVNGKRVALSSQEQAEIEAEWTSPPSDAEIQQMRQAMTVERWSFATAAMAAGILTAEEAQAWGPGTSLPAAVDQAITAAVSDPVQLAGAKVRALAAPRINRLNPLVEILRGAFSLTPEQADDLFTMAKALEAE